LFGIGSSEIFLVLIIALLVFGPARLPEIAKKLGEASREFRKMIDQVVNPDPAEDTKERDEHATNSIRRDD
jgi:TatA/E family protein of Tat protein translocase